MNDATYAERHNPDAAFGIDPSTVHFLAVVLDATRNGRVVSVKLFHDADHPLAGEIVKGVARHVVNPANDAFADTWTERARLRITATFEFFVALGDVEAIVIEDDAPVTA